MSKYDTQPVKQTATEVAEVAAADYMREEFFGELRLQSGLEYGHYSNLTLQSFDADTAYYEGLTVHPASRLDSSGRWDSDDATRLGVPLDHDLWLARTMVADIGQTSRSNHIGSGYFWESEDGVWATDVRNIAGPEQLGDMAQERNRRVRLIENIKNIGARAVCAHLENLEDISVQVTSTQGLTYQGIINTDTIKEILNRYKYGRKQSPGVGQPLPSVLEKLRLEDHL